MATLFQEKAVSTNALAARQSPFPERLNHALEEHRLQIVYRPPAELKLSPDNPRKHPERQIEKLCQLEDRFGFLVPAIIDQHGNVIVGHARIEAAIRIGLQQIPTICVGFLNSSELRAFRIAENKISEFSEWDFETLGQELAAIQADLPDLDLEILGFETAELDILLAPSSNTSKPDPADQIPENSGEPTVTVPGDIWLAGVHRIACGNSLHHRPFAQLMQGDRADMVFTDEPYNVPIRGHVTSGKRHGEFAMASGEMSEPAFKDFLAQANQLMSLHTREGALIYQMMDWRHCATIVEAARATQLDFLNVCVWIKNNGGMGSFYRSAHEFCFVFRHGGGQHRNNVQLGKHGRYRTNVWAYDGLSSFGKGRDGALKDHPTQKPIALVADAIKDCTCRGGIVLDPFMGSGTTVLAAERTGRIARAMDIDPRYVDVSVHRWEKLTGCKAVHARLGKTFEEIAALRRKDAGEER